jgi:hypothetical protein
MQSKQAIKWMVLVPLALLLAVTGIGTADEPLAIQPSAISCGDSATCSTAGSSVKVQNSGAGTAFEGQHTWAGIGVEGKSNRGVGVKGSSNRAAGVKGWSWAGNGVAGISELGYGVNAYSANSYAIYGISEAYRGGYLRSGTDWYPDLVLAANSATADNGVISSDPDQSSSDIVLVAYDTVRIDLNQDDAPANEGTFEVYNADNQRILNLDEEGNFEVRNYGDVPILQSEVDGDLKIANDLYLHANNAADVGEIRATSGAYHDMMLTSNDSIYADLDEDGNQSDSCFVFRRSDHSQITSVCESKGTTFTGSQQVAVDTTAGQREMYTPGSTELWFEDLGSAALVDGQATVTIDPLFAETVNLDAEYHVFVQVYGDAEVYVSNRTPSHFEVHLRDGDPSVEFSYRIVAKRLGYESQRLEQVDLTPAVQTEP